MGSATPSLPLRHIQGYRLGEERIGCQSKECYFVLSESWGIFFQDKLTLLLWHLLLQESLQKLLRHLYCKPPWSGNDSGWQVDFENCQSLIRSLISLPCESRDRCVIWYPSFDWIGLPWKMLSFTLYKWLLLHDLTMKIENISNAIFTD